MADKTKTSASLQGAIEAEVLLHGEDHPSVARAHTDYGEFLLTEGDVGAARHHFDYAFRIYDTLANGSLNEDLVDAHYRVGQAIAAESRVTGANAASRKHFLKTLAMREDLDAAIEAARAEERLNATLGNGQSTSDEQKLPTLSSSVDSTMIYADLAESDRAAGNFKDAAILYGKSIKLRRQKFGEASAAVGQVLLKYGETLRLSLKYAEAKSAIDEALAIYMQLYGPKHVSVTEALNAAGQVQRLLGHLQEAEALLLESLKLRREMHGDFHVSTASSLNNLAEVCREKEDYFQAISYHNLAIEAFTKAVGQDHPGTMNAKGNLGVTLRRQAKQSQELGQELVKQAMDFLRTQQYDEEHPWRAKFDTENAMAQAEHLASQGKIDESLQLYDALINKKHIVAQLNATLGGTGLPDQLSIASAPLTPGLGAGSTASLSPSGSIVSSSSLPKKASQDVVLLTEGRLQLLLKRANSMLAQGQYIQAEGVYKQTLDSSRIILGQESVHIYTLQVAYGECLTALGRYLDAQAVLEVALQSRIDLKGPDDVEVAHASFALAQVYRLCANFDTSQALYVHALESVTVVLSKDPFAMEKTSVAVSGAMGARGMNELFGRILVGLAKLHAVKGLLPKSRALLLQAKETTLKTLSEQHPLYADILSAEAVNNIATGNLPEATKGLKESLARRLAATSSLAGNSSSSSSSSANTSTSTYKSMHSLARLYLIQGEYTAAASYIEEAVRLCDGLFGVATAAAADGKSAPPSPSSMFGSTTDETKSSTHPAMLRLLHTKAQLLVALGEYEPAQRLLESTLVSRRIILGGRHHSVADTLFTLSEAQLRLGLPFQAQEGLQLALDVYRELFGDTHPSVFRATRLFAESLLMSGHYPQALQMIQDLIPETESYYKKIGMREHVDLALNLILASKAFGCNFQLEECRSHALTGGKMLAQLMNSWELTLSGMAVLMSDGLEALALSLGLHFHCRSVRAVFSLSFSLRAHTLPLTHTLALTTKQLALDNLVLVGYFNSFLGGLEEVMEGLGNCADKSVTSIDVSILQARAVLFAAQSQPDRERSEARQAAAEAAEALYLQAMFTAKEVLSEQSVKYCLILAELGECMQLQGKGKFANAANLYQEAMSLLRQCYDNNDQTVHFMSVQLKQCYLLIEQNDQETALPVLEKRVLPVLDLALGTEHPLTVYARGLLGICYNDRKKQSGMELIRKALLFFEDYPHFAFSAEHSFVLNLGGYESSAKTNLLSTNVKEGALLEWCIPQPAPESADEEGSLGGSLGGLSTGAKPFPVYYDHNDQPIAHEIYSPFAVVGERDCVSVSADDWGAVGRTKGKIKQDVVTLGSLLTPKAAKTGTKADSATSTSPGDGSEMIVLHQSQQAVQVLLNRIKNNTSTLYADALSLAAELGLVSAGGFGGSFGGLGTVGAGSGGGVNISMTPAEAARYQKESAARTAAAGREIAHLQDGGSVGSGSRLLDEEESGDEGEVRGKLKELKAQLEEEEQQLAEIRLRKMAEEAEASEMHALREQEEEEMVKIAKRKKEEEITLQSLQAQRQAEQEEMNAVEAAKNKHAEDLRKVMDELDARREEVAQAEYDLKKLMEERNITASLPIGSTMPGASSAPPSAAAEGETVAEVAGTAGGVDTEGAVATAAIEGHDDKTTASVPVPAAAAAAPAAAPVPSKLTEKDKARLSALEASAFLYTRALELREGGRYHSAVPLIEECVALRAKYMYYQDGHLDALFQLALSLTLSGDISKSGTVLAECLEQRTSKHLTAQPSHTGSNEAESNDDSYSVSANTHVSSFSAPRVSSIEIAEILQAQGANLFALGKFPRALVKIGEAVKMFLEVCGDAHDKTARCFTQQSACMLQLGRFEEAKAIADRSFAILNKIYGTRDAITSTALMARVHAYFAVGNTKDAKPLIEQSISMRKRLLNERHPGVAECYVVMGRILMHQGQLLESERWITMAYEIVLENFAVDSLAVADVEFYLARLLTINGKLAEASKLHQQVLESRQKHLPLINTPDEIEALKPKPKTEEELDAEADLALKTGKKAVEVKPPAPVTHCCIQDSMQALGEICLLLGDFDEADRLFKAVSKLRREYLSPKASAEAAASGSDAKAKAASSTEAKADEEEKVMEAHPDLISTYFLRAELFRLQGQGAKAKSLYSMVSDMAIKLYGKLHPSYLQAQFGLARTLVGTDDVEAEKLFRKTLRKFKDSLSDDHYLYADAQAAYGNTLRRLGQLDLAYDQLQESIACRRMLFFEVNPSHLALIEGVCNMGLWTLERMRPPPKSAEESTTEGASTTGADNSADAAEDDEEEADDVAAMQRRAQQQARISGKGQDDDTVVSELPPVVDGNVVPELSDSEKLEALLDEGRALEAGVGVRGASGNQRGHGGDDDADVEAAIDDDEAVAGEQEQTGEGGEQAAEEEEPQEPFERDADGVPIFDSSTYTDVERDFALVLETLRAIYTLPKGSGSSTVFLQHPYAINLEGNIGIVRKLEYEQKLRFLADLRKEDRLIFRRKERRLAKAAAAAGAGDAKSVTTTKDEPAVAASASAPADNGSIGGNSTTSFAQSLASALEDDEEDEASEKDLPIPGQADIDAAVVKLQERGISELHPWVAKFLSYRVVVEAPADELGIAKMLIEQGTELHYRGFYSAADLKFDESLSMLLDYLTGTAAETSPVIALTLLIRADSALAQHRLDDARKLYMQCYFMYTKIGSNNAESDGALRALHGVAAVLLARGLAEDARLLAETVYKGRIALFGKQHIITATTQVLLARCQLEQGMLTEAETIAKMAVATCESLDRPPVGKDGLLYTTEAKLVLGLILLQKGDLTTASQSIKAAHEGRVRVLGDHACVADTLDALANLRVLQGKLLESRKLSGQAMRIRLKTLARIKYNSVKLSQTAQVFLDKTPVQDPPPDAADAPAASIGGDNTSVSVSGKKLSIPSGAIAPTAQDAFGGRAGAMDRSLAALIASTLNAITGAREGDSVTSADAKATGTTQQKQQAPSQGAKPGFTYRGLPVSPHGHIADTLMLRGSICLMLGEVQEGREMVEGAYSIRKDIFGRSSVPVTRSLAQLATLTLTLGLTAESLTLNTISYNLRLQLLGDSHPLVGEALLAMAVCKIRLGKLDEASGALADSKKIARALYGTSHFVYAHSLLAEGSLLLVKGEYVQASAAVSKSLEIYKSLREVHPWVADALLLDTQVNLAMGELDVAQVRAEQALSQRAVFLSDDNLAVAEARHVMAIVMRAQGKLLEAKPLIEQALTNLRDRLGKRHPLTLSSLTLLAYNMLDCGQHVSAIPILARAADVFKALLGEDSLLRSWAMLGLAQCCLVDAEFPRCLELVDTVELIRMRVLGSGQSHPLVLEVKMLRASLAIRMGQLEEPTKALDDLLALRRMAIGQMHPDVAGTLYALGELLHLRGKLSEARSIHERCLKMRRTVLGVDHPELTDSQLAMAHLALSGGKLEQAAAMLQRCLSNFRIKRGSRHPCVATTLLLLGRANNALGNLDEARSYLLDALALRKASFHSHGAHPEVAEALLALADNLALRGRYCLVEPNFVQPVRPTADSQASAGAGARGGDGDGGGSVRSGDEGSQAGSREEKDEGEPVLLPLFKSTSPAPAPLVNPYIISNSDASPSPSPSPAPAPAPLPVPDEGSVVSGMSVSSIPSPSARRGPSQSDPNATSDASLAADTVHMSQIEERFGYLSIDDFLAEDPAEADRRLEEDAPYVLRNALVADDAIAVSASSDAIASGAPKSGKQRAKEEKEKQAARDAVKAVQRGKDLEREKLRQRLAGPDEEEELFSLPLLERALDSFLRVLGFDHHRTFAAQHAIAETLLGLGRVTLSHDLYLHVLIDRRRVLGDDHLDSVASHLGLAEVLRVMSKVYPENTAAAAEKRTMPKVEKALGPSLVQHLTSILGKVQGLQKLWPPEASTALVLLEAGRVTTETLHPLLSPPKKKLESRDRYLGGFMGYAFPTPKKLKRVERDGAVTRPPKTYYHDAKWLYDLAQGGLKRCVGESDAHPLLANMVFGKAELMRARRRPDLAIPLYEECLSIRRRVYRANHPGIADCLQGLAEIYRTENKLSRCVPLLEKVLEIRREAFGSEEHPSFAEAQCSLAMVLYAQGRYHEAEPLYKQSLVTRETLLGHTHIATAMTLNNYAGLLHTLGRNAEALPFYQRALEIKANTFGEDHPDVACAKNNCGLLLKALNRFPEARELYTQAHASQLKVFGQLHPDVAATLNNLAALEVAIWGQGQDADALQRAKNNYRESLEIKQKVLGLDNPAVAATLNNLAGLCLACGDIEDARDFYEESLRIRRLAFGDDHVSVAESLNNVALLMFTQGQMSSAVPLFERSIVIKQSSYGDSHTSTAASLHNLAVCLHRLRRYVEAEAMYTRALEIRLSRLGKEHPDTIKSLHGMAALRQDLQDAANGVTVQRERQLQQASGKESVEKRLIVDSPSRRELQAALAAAAASLEDDSIDLRELV